MTVTPQTLTGVVRFEDVVAKVSKKSVVTIPRQLPAFGLLDLRAPEYSGGVYYQQHVLERLGDCI